LGVDGGGVIEEQKRGRRVLGRVASGYSLLLDAKQIGQGKKDF
jgi:hypothetical protein